MRTSRLAGLAMVLLVAAVSCFNPVHSDAVAALGPEAPGEGPSKNHRPGQPCLTCHGGAGPGSPEFVFAGTLYETRNNGTPAVGATVTLKDASGVERTMGVNKVGNFYLDFKSWSPVYPVSATVTDSAGKSATMFTTIGRNGSCAFCHYGADNEPNHMPPLFVKPQ